MTILSENKALFRQASQSLFLSSIGILQKILASDLVSLSVFTGLQTRMISREGILKKGQELSTIHGPQELLHDNSNQEEKLYAKIDQDLEAYLREKRDLFTQFVTNDENEILSYDEDSASMIKKTQEDLSLVDSNSIYIFK